MENETIDEIMENKIYTTAYYNGYYAFLENCSLDEIPPDYDDKQTDSWIIGWIHAKDVFGEPQMNLYWYIIPLYNKIHNEQDN